MVKAHESPHTKISILRFRFSCAIRSGLSSLLITSTSDLFFSRCRQSGWILNAACGNRFIHSCPFKSIDEFEEE